MVFDSAKLHRSSCCLMMSINQQPILWQQTFFSAAGFAAWVLPLTQVRYRCFKCSGLILIGNLNTLHEGMELITLLFHGDFQVLEQPGMAVTFPIQHFLQLLDGGL